VRPLRVGTRGSPLALWQARAVATALADLGIPAELVPISTRGDQRPNVPLDAIGGKGVFVKEIQDALLAGDIDLAVHSAKDMAASSPDGLTIAAALPREDPRDALVLRGELVRADVPRGEADTEAVAQAFRPASATDMPAWVPGRMKPAPTYGLGGDSDAARLGRQPLIGTGSPRRIAQLRRIFPAARFEPIRGNVDTRLRKLDAGEADALVLACAGLRRLGLTHRITAAIPVIDCVPAPGQGIIAIEVRSDDGRTRELVGALNDVSSRMALAAEQSIVAELGGGCLLPLGALAQVHGRELSIRAVVASLDGTAMIESDTTGDHPVEVGTRAARELASGGARELLNS